VGKIISLSMFIVALACASAMPTPSLQNGPRDPGSAAMEGQIVRIAVAAAVANGKVGATGKWIASLPSGDKYDDGPVGGSWTVVPAGGRVRFSRPDGTAFDQLNVEIIPLRSSAGESYATWNGKRYRGQIVITATDSGLLVVNRVPLESYLRGVVPLEIGNRKPEEHAAVEAQAVAARSYSYLHLVPTRAYDMVSTVQDQVYGGVGCGEAALRRRRRDDQRIGRDVCGEGHQHSLPLDLRRKHGCGSRSLVQGARPAVSQSSERQNSGN
jgi:Sporulation protein and related proteins